MKEWIKKYWIGVILGLVCFVIAWWGSRNLESVPYECSSEIVVASYFDNNGGSPLFRIATKDSAGNVHNHYYWDSTPFVGETLNFCN